MRQFIGVVNYYRNMFSRKSHTLSPLTIITPNKVKFKWNKIKQHASDEIKWIVDRNTLLTYPNFRENFKIHTNASVFQLEAVVSQKGKPIDFYHIKLNDSHKRYIVTEK